MIHFMRFTAKQHLHIKHKTADFNSLTVTTMKMIIKFRLNNLIFTENAVSYKAKDISNEYLMVKSIRAVYQPYKPMDEIDDAEKLIQINSLTKNY